MNIQKKQIKTYSELIEFLKNSDVKYDFGLIEKAYNFVLKFHKDQTRLSGDSYETHVLNVAYLIAQLNLDTTSVVCALLHDSVEKGTAKIDDIDAQFGTEVSFIIDSLTSIKTLTQNYSPQNETLQNIKNLVLSSTEDVRVIIIRIAEKLDNVYNLNNLDSAIKKSSAEKIMNIYGPLAEYLGLGYFKRELEDNAFKILNPEEYQTSLESIRAISNEKESVVTDFKSDFENLLNKAGINYIRLQTRVKSVYSAFKKVKRKYTKPTEKVSLEGFLQLRDLFAARVILNNIEECYMVLGLVHGEWSHDINEFDDYISKPKENGYRTIQTSVSYKGIFVEVQIRTEEMHEYNEFGPASHIAYKLIGSKSVGNTMTWTKDLVRWQNNQVIQEDVYKIKLFANSIFVFTPKGLLIRLDNGATPLDFAFRVHSDIGSRYGGALVNGKMVNKEYKLKTGETVEIITNSKPTVNSSWLNIVKSTSTKQRIRKLLNL